MKKFFSIILPIALLLSACGDPDKTDTNGGTQNSNQNSTINSNNNNNNNNGPANNNNNGPANNNNNGNPSNTTPGTPATVTKVVNKGAEGWPCSEIHPCDEGLKCVSNDPLHLVFSKGTCQKVESCTDSSSCASSSLGKDCLHITVLPEKEGATLKPPQRERTCGKCSDFALCGETSQACVLGPDLRTGTCEAICEKDDDCKADPKKTTCAEILAVTSGKKVCIEADKVPPGGSCDVSKPDGQCMDGFVCAADSVGEKTGRCTQECGFLGEKSPDCTSVHAEKCVEGEIAASGTNTTGKYCWPSHLPHYNDPAPPTVFAGLDEKCTLEKPCDPTKDMHCVGTTIFPTEGVCKLPCFNDAVCTSEDSSLKCGKERIPVTQRLFIDKHSHIYSTSRYCEAAP